VRISSIPTTHGERIVMRLLDKTSKIFNLEEIGLSPQNNAILREYLVYSHGIILLTGPTGSGKTTTLYAALNEVDTTQKNVLTIEDPVEYSLPGISQVQVNVKKGLTFAHGLRSFLRQDPDVMMVGEIRDLETAEVAVRAALTGHLVFSTVHTNDSASTVTRLIDIGVEPYLLSATLLGVLAQRLVRCNCRRCVAAEEVDPAIRKLLGVSEEEVFYRGRGCEECNHTGYSGRMAVYELLRATSDLRDLVQDGVTSATLHAQGLKDGMTPLTQNAIAQARQRRTSLAEVYRVRLE